MDRGPMLRRVMASVAITITLANFTKGLTKNFVNQSMPELRPMFVVNFDMSSVICQHSSDPADLHMHDMSILCDGKMDCYSNPAMHDESFPYCEGHCNSTCSDRGACLFDGKKAQCYCNAGFHGWSCELEDLNECAEKPCHWMAHCQNTFGSYECSCFPGFGGDGFECTDIDECETGEAECPVNSACVNLPGTYLCNCSEGYMPKGIPLEKCADIDECETDMHDCGKEHFCQNTLGGFGCVYECEPGYKLANGTCVDVDECLEDGRCDKRATCENLPGSFKCQCDEGFTGDGRSCIPLTDCSQDDSICDRHAFCIGAFRTCLCQAGYKGDGLTCEDENECDAKNNPCENQRGKRCVNIEGGYICCDEFTSDSECIKAKGVYCSGGCGLHAVCYNQTCQCLEGFTGDPMSKCSDVNECEDDKVCPGVGSWCVNMIGGHVCCEAGSERVECREVEILRTNVGNVVIQLNETQVQEVVHLGGASTFQKGGVLIRSGDLNFTSLRSKILSEFHGNTGCERGCPADSMCVGGQCECRPGFVGDPRLGCSDVNECDDLSTCNHIKGAWCLNTIGSYHCCTRRSSITDCIGLEISLTNGTIEMGSSEKDEDDDLHLKEESGESTVRTEVFGQWQNFSGGQIIIGKGKVKDWEEEGKKGLMPGQDRWGLEISVEEPESKKR